LQRDRERDDWPEQRGRTRDETAAGGSRGGLVWWWPDARRDGDRGLAWWSRVVVAGRETRRPWQGARVVISGGGLAGSRGEKRRQRRRQRNGSSGSTRGGGSGSTELALLEWLELAESGRNLQREVEE